MRYLPLLLLLAGCATSTQMAPYSVNSEKSSEEHFDAPFDQVVNAALAAVSDLGMYVEDRRRSGLDQLITVRSLTSGRSFEDLLEIRIEQPSAQGVTVTVSRKNAERTGYSDDAESILRAMTLRLGR